MKPIIQLNSHALPKNYIKQIKGHIYKLIANTDYCRAGKIGEDMFVDPPNGPMIIENHKLDCISKTSWYVQSIDFTSNGIHITLTSKL